MFFVLCVLFGFSLATADQETPRSAMIPRTIPEEVVLKGQWSKMSENAQEMNKTDAQKRLQGVMKTNGTVFLGDFKFGVFNNQSDFFEGVLALRDGQFVTDEMYNYAVKGMYLHKIGLLVGLAEGITEDDNEDGKNVTDGVVVYNGTQSDVALAEKEFLDSLNIKFEKSDVCPLVLALRVSAIPSDKGGDLPYDLSSLTITGQIISKECGFALNITAVRHSNHKSRTAALRYLSVVYFAGVMYLHIAKHQMKTVTSVPLASQLSVASVIIIAAMDFFVSLIHVALSLGFGSFFHMFVFAAVLFFVKFGFFDCQLLFHVFKARNPQVFSQGGERLRRLLTNTYLAFYVVIFTVVTLISIVPKILYVLLVAGMSFWVPQIIQNVRTDHFYTFTPQNIVGTTAILAGVPLYFMTFPGKFVSLPNHFGFAICLTIHVGVQLVIMYLQYLYGPRFFLPKSMRPEKYNYRRPIPEELTRLTDTDRFDCAICLCHVDIPEPSQAESLSPEERHMITPCGHIFHEDCLTRWFEQKLECPVCRSTVPLP